MPRRQTSILTRMRPVEALIFFGPLILTYCVFYFFSAAFLLTTSFEKVSNTLTDGKWVGWKNYYLLLTDSKFITAIANNFIFAGVAIAAGLLFGFAIAVSLSSGVRGKSLYYAVFLLPSLMPLALIATVFQNLLEARFGLLNTVLRDIGLGDLALQWLIEPGLAYGVVCALLVYLIGLPILYYTANLATINTSLLEAAVLDGASTPRLVWEILFPLMRGTHKTIILSSLLATFRAFELVFFTTGGGPAGTTEITGTYVYHFSTTGVNMGYASAAALVVLVISLALSVIQVVVQRFSK